jgi:chromosomal replication initiator protein
MTLSFHASLSGKADLSVADAEEQLHAQIAEEITSRSISIEEIQRTVAEFFNLSIADLLGSKRTKNIAEPRMVAMVLARELTTDSSTAVGAAFGRNHATILHAEKQVKLLCDKDENMRRSVAQIKRKLQK